MILTQKSFFRLAHFVSKPTDFDKALKGKAQSLQKREFTVVNNRFCK